MKVFTVVGARPEFIQLTSVTAAIRERHSEVLVHTGQHFDDNMSKVFFEELNLPQPEYYLGVGGGSHGSQTGQMLVALEGKMLEEKPDWVLVFGDTNSTVAGALAAAKLHIPIAHIEAGLRSYDRKMPEEVNRVITDHLSELLLSPTNVAVQNLAKEGITRGVELVGDVRVDVMPRLKELARDRAKSLLSSLNIGNTEPFALATIHRASNTDDRERLLAILEAIGGLGIPVVLPVHPRLRKMVDQFGLQFPDNLRVTLPVGILDMVAMIDASRLVITDSGGLQKEAYLLNRPAVTLRDTTEWVETIDVGWNRLCEPSQLPTSVNQALTNLPTQHPALYGELGVGRRIVQQLERFLS
jgi:UDP-N-acetylglucosamine 2-epimerase